VPRSSKQLKSRSLSAMTTGGTPPAGGSDSSSTTSATCAGDACHSSSASRSGGGASDATRSASSSRRGSVDRAHVPIWERSSTASPGDSRRAAAAAAAAASSPKVLHSVPLTTFSPTLGGLGPTLAAGVALRKTHGHGCSGTRTLVLWFATPRRVMCHLPATMSPCMQSWPSSGQTPRQLVAQAAAAAGAWRPAGRARAARVHLVAAA
jgi:hypothetical protein